MKYSQNLIILVLYLAFVHWAFPIDTNVVNVAVADHISVESPKQQQSYDQKGVYERVPEKEIATPDAGTLKVAITEYVGPNGKGFHYTYIFVDAKGVTWTRCINVGPDKGESWRNHDWRAQPAVVAAEVAESTPDK